MSGLGVLQRTHVELLIIALLLGHPRLLLLTKALWLNKEVDFERWGGRCYWLVCFYDSHYMCHVAWFPFVSALDTPGQPAVCGLPLLYHDDLPDI